MCRAVIDVTLGLLWALGIGLLLATFSFSLYFSHHSDAVVDYDTVSYKSKVHARGSAHCTFYSSIPLLHSTVLN